MPEEKPVSTANPQENAAVNTAAPAAKPGKSKKDPSAPTLVPFQLISLKNRERLAAIGKADDKTLTVLLDAFEDRQPIDADNRSGELQKQIDQLKQELSASKQTITEQDKQIAAMSAEHDANTDSAILQLQAENSAKDQAIAELNSKITEMTGQIEAKDKMLLELDKLTKGQPDIKELKNQISQMQDVLKENRKVLQNRSEQAAAYDQKVAELEHQVEDLKKKRKELQQELDNYNATQYSNPEGFLGAFEPIVAFLLRRTADKMTEMRTDGLQVQPSMILGDMFLKYTLQKRTMWFYKWVLSDSEILDIAKSINPNIESVRMLRKVLNVDKELI